MQRLLGRSIVFGALAVLACSGDPTGNEGTPTLITANPDVVFVPQDDSTAVIVTVVDEDGQILQSDPTVSDVGAGIAVDVDPNFQAVTTENPIRRQTRFFVKGQDLTATTFTINAFGLSKVIQVTSVPSALKATISDTVPEIGSPVTLTLPAGVFLTDSSELTVGGLPQVIQSQDAATGVIVFLPAPNSDDPAVVSNIGVNSNPNLVFTLATPDHVHTDSITVFPSTISSTTPAGGQVVTLTSTDPRFSFGPTSQVILGFDSTLTQTAAGSTLTFLPSLGSVGPITVKDVFIGGYPVTVPSTTLDIVTVGTDTPPAIFGTGSVATAPTIALVVGTARGVLDKATGGDAGCVALLGAVCQDYKLTVPADDSIFVTANFDGDSDVGVYFFGPDGTTQAGNLLCDAKGAGAGLNKPETCGFLLTAGPYVMRVAFTGPGLPAWINVRLSIH